MSGAKRTISGVHHVTAISGDAQRNIDFYAGVLGLRLVKLTVNFDDPNSYHLYYGDALGRPGTLVTFFVWPGAYRGMTGPPQVTAMAWAVPAMSLAYWRDRLKRHGATLRAEAERFGEQVLGFTDPDGLQGELVAMDEPKGEAWAAGPVPVEAAIRGLHGVTIAEEGQEDTAELLVGAMGFNALVSEGNRARYTAGGASGVGAVVDVVCVPDAPRGGLGAGVVHHVAFETADDAQQEEWRKELRRREVNLSPVMDRKYFHSIYFREPGGVLFEIATAGPGVTVDEAAEELGTRLMLPGEHEAHREEIERALPRVELPKRAERSRGGDPGSGGRR